MDENKIRKLYQRNDPNDQRGLNEGGINNFIRMLKLHENSTDKNIRSIAENFEAVENLAPNFTIFESQKDNKCFFMHQFKALQIGKNTDPLVASHEFGHAVLSMTTDVKVPENYGEILSRAKKHALSPENKETFKAYIEFLCKYGKEVITESEKGPVSDIISSVFQEQALRIGTYENICWFPNSHTHDYYTEKETGEPNLKVIFDEDFANFYALKSTNSKKEIETLKTLFGTEFVETLENQLELSAEIFEKAVDKDVKKVNPSKDIMPALQGIKTQDVLDEAKDLKSLQEEKGNEDKTFEDD